MDLQERIADLQQQANQIAIQVLNSNAQYQNLAGRIQELQSLVEDEKPEVKKETK